MLMFRNLALVLIYALGLDLFLSGSLQILYAVSMANFSSLFFARILTIAIFVYHLPYFCLLIGCKPRSKDALNICLKAVVRQYKAYSDPKDIDFESATEKDVIEKKFGFEATNVRFALTIKNSTFKQITNLKISPWQFDYIFKNKNECLIALRKFIQPTNPIYFYIFPWLKFCTYDMSIYGRLAYAVVMLIIMVLYSVFLLTSIS